MQTLFSLSANASGRIRKSNSSLVCFYLNFNINDLLCIFSHFLKIFQKTSQEQASKTTAIVEALKTSHNAQNVGNISSIVIRKPRRSGTITDLPNKHVYTYAVKGVPIKLYSKDVEKAVLFSELKVCKVYGCILKFLNSYLIF